MTKCLMSVLFALLLTSCKSKPDALPDLAYFPPTAGLVWETTDPQKLGWDVAKLNETIDLVGNSNSKSFIILYKGRIVVEKYWSGWTLTNTQAIASASKSVSALMTGIAQEKNGLDINKKVSDYLGKGWSAASQTKEDLITVRHLITMSSGLDDNLSYYADAGKDWYYNTNAYYKSLDILEKISKKSLRDYSKEVLWDKIGMQNTTWINIPSLKTMVCSGRDMARFGLLVLNNGKWNGTAVINDSDFLNQMQQTSQSLNPAYGYLWWLNGQKSYKLPSGNPQFNNVGTGLLIPAAPVDMVSALGKGDQKIYVVKSKDLVVIRQGEDAKTSESRLALTSFDNLLWQKLSLAIK
ncbi:MAG: class A beta-lactamase-related serine hydrolase [Runella slithyformis]|nr:MAG: class A beta-lactamase-related serine hydrolase [Runella slithyformis]